MPEQPSAPGTATRAEQAPAAKKSNAANIDKEKVAKATGSAKATTAATRAAKAPTKASRPDATAARTAPTSRPDATAARTAPAPGAPHGVTIHTGGGGGTSGEPETTRRRPATLTDEATASWQEDRESHQPVEWRQAGFAPESLWRSIRSCPGYAAELVALAAVARLGHEARSYVASLRSMYPEATADGLARLVTRRFVRQARNRGAAAGLVGAFGVLADSASLAWTQARLVLHLASAYGVDPTDPRRAAELLVLQGVHPDLASAQKALDEAQSAMATARSTQGVPDREKSRRAAMPLSWIAGKGVLRAVASRRAARLLPGAGALVAAVANARSTERLATRAVKQYRRRATA